MISSIKNADVATKTSDDNKKTISSTQNKKAATTSRTVQTEKAQQETKPWKHPDATIRNIFLIARKDATKQVEGESKAYLLKKKRPMSDKQKTARVSEVMYLNARQLMIKKILELQASQAGDTSNRDDNERQINLLVAEQVSILFLTLQSKVIEAISNNNPGTQMQIAVNNAFTSSLQQVNLQSTSMQNPTTTMNVEETFCDSESRGEGEHNLGTGLRQPTTSIVTTEQAASSTRTGIPPGLLQGATYDTTLAAQQGAHSSNVYGHQAASSALAPWQEEVNVNEEHIGQRRSHDLFHEDEEVCRISKRQRTSSSGGIQEAVVATNTSLFDNYLNEAMRSIAEVDAVSEFHATDNSSSHVDTTHLMTPETRLSDPYGTLQLRSNIAMNQPVNSALTANGNDQIEEDEVYTGLSLLEAMPAMDLGNSVHKIRDDEIWGNNPPY